MDIASTGIQYVRAWTGSDATLPKNIWCCLIKASPMSEEFHDWLDKCPVIWIRDRVEKDHVFYAFETPNEEDDET